MRILRLLTLGIAVALSQVLAPTSASACSCWWPGVAYGYHYSDAIFIGKASHVEREGEYGPTKMTLRVEMVWRGALDQQATIWTGNGNGDCGYVFDPGETYLVFARRSSWDGKFRTGLCTGTGPIAQRTQIVTQLASLQATEQERGARIHGKVTRGAYAATWRDEVWIGATIVAASPGHSTEILTDQHGQFQLDNLPPGLYKVFVKASPNEATRAVIVELSDNHHYAQVDLQGIKSQFKLPE